MTDSRPPAPAPSARTPASTAAPIFGRTVIALGVVSLLTDIASDMAMPFLPTLLEQLGAGAAVLGLVEGVATATSAVMKFVVGVASDRSPRKKPLVLLGYTVSNVARPLLALAFAPWQVLAVRFVDRVGKGVRTSPRDALLARSSPRQHHGLVFGFHRAMDNVGAVIGPLVATAILHAAPGQLRLVLAATAIPGALSVLCVAFGVREELKPEEAAASKKLPLSLRGGVPEGMRGLLGVVSLFTLANASDTLLLLRARELGVSLANLPLVWGALSLVRALAATPGGWFADRIGHRKAMALGWALYAVAYAGFGFSESPVVAAASLLLYGLYYGLTEGTERAMVAAMVPDSQLGRAFGYFNLATGLLVLPASLLFGLLLPLRHGLYSYGLCALLSATAAILMLTLVPPERRP